MLLQKMEEYLDGGLSAAEGAEVEALVARDPVAARQMAGVKAERALRAAAYASYAPAAAESASLAGELLAVCHDEALQPVGRIGFGMRRGAAIAASLMIVAGTFFAGRLTSPTQIVNVPGPTKTVYSVAYYENGVTNGGPIVSEFSTEEEYTSFMTELKARGTGIAIVDLTTPGHM